MYINLSAFFREDVKGTFILFSAVRENFSLKPFFWFNEKKQAGLKNHLFFTDFLLPGFNVGVFIRVKFQFQFYWSSICLISFIVVEISRGN